MRNSQQGTYTHLYYIDMFELILGSIESQFYVLSIDATFIKIRALQPNIRPSLVHVRFLAPTVGIMNFDLKPHSTMCTFGFS